MDVCLNRLRIFPGHADIPLRFFRDRLLTEAVFLPDHGRKPIQRVERRENLCPVFPVHRRMLRKRFPVFRPSPYQHPDIGKGKSDPFLVPVGFRLPRFSHLPQSYFDRFLSACKIMLCVPLFVCSFPWPWHLPAGSSRVPARSSRTVPAPRSWRPGSGVPGPVPPDQ